VGKNIREFRGDLVGRDEGRANKRSINKVSMVFCGFQSELDKVWLGIDGKEIKCGVFSNGLRRVNPILSIPSMIHRTSIQQCIHFHLYLICAEILYPVER
jgi:hypothetical protein